MATFQQREIQRLFIGQAATKTTGRLETMNEGEIGIFTPSGVRLTESTAATATRFVIAKATPDGGIDILSDPITKANIKSAKASLYVAATDQITNVGYNGTDGSIDVLNDNGYVVRLSFDESRTSNHGGLYIKRGFFKSSDSATEFEIAHGLLKSLVAEFSKEPERLVKTEMLSDDAGAALGAAATLTVTYGSKYIVASAGGHDLVAGDAVRIGGTATTDPVYVVESVSGTQIKLTTPYQGTTAAGVAGEELTALTGSFGIKLTGLPQGYRVGKLDQDLQPLIFNVTLESAGSTTLVTPTQAIAGNGTEKQVKALEFFCQGNEGNILRAGEPLTFDRRAEASGNYDMIDIYTEEIYTGSITSGPIKKHYTLAIPQSTPNYALTGTADDITDVLEVLCFGSVNGNLTV